GGAGDRGRGVRPRPALVGKGRPAPASGAAVGPGGVEALGGSSATGLPPRCPASSGLLGKPEPEPGTLAHQVRGAGGPGKGRARGGPARTGPPPETDRLAGGGGGRPQPPGTAPC